MKKAMLILAMFVALLIPASGMAAQDYVLGVSEFVLTSTTGVSTVGTLDARTEYVLIGVGGSESGSSVFWIPATMTGAAGTARGITIPASEPVFRIDGLDIAKKSQFGTCSTSAVTVYFIQMGKP